MAPQHFDVVAIGAHPDDLEAVMGGTAAKLAAKGRSILFVDLCDITTRSCARTATESRDSSPMSRSTTATLRQR
jgi:LmbE family N-acetylglucosaminyl deacetylase